jgi:hypothetical protein
MQVYRYREARESCEFPECDRVGTVATPEGALCSVCAADLIEAMKEEL